MIAASVLFEKMILPNNNSSRLGYMAIAQTQPSSSSHLHYPGLLHYPQDPFHYLFPIRAIESSALLDRGGDALSRSASLMQPSLQETMAMTADGNCEMCQVINYIPGPLGKAGLAYKSAQTLDLTGAQRIVFFAKGELGGENVAFVAIGKAANAASVSPNIFINVNIPVISKNVTLTNDWQRYQLSLNGIDLTGVTDPFGFIVSRVRSQIPSSNIPNTPLIDANPNHITFFLKGVTIDNNPAINPIPTVKLSPTNTNIN